MGKIVFLIISLSIYFIGIGIVSGVMMQCTKMDDDEAWTIGSIWPFATICYIFMLPIKAANYITIKILGHFKKK